MPRCERAATSSEVPITNGRERQGSRPSSGRNASGRLCVERTLTRPKTSQHINTNKKTK